ncbi:IQ domain-containing protein E isoform X2 [Cynoglossus semilaevis]|uniref:IQ domain-containing protein E isoform X2 n=1 Tax=Cynoglossus semilaevis TaxID=244447 RepID=UPI000D631658|nr:IQ domain-containing protein E isoform X2 [Cynoglossus semilaevis]
MSLEASDVQTDEDCEELVEDGSSFSVDSSEKRTRRKRSSGKPPHSARSPYLSSLNTISRRAAVAAWRPSGASPGDTRRERPGESDSAHLSSLSNGHDLSHTLRSVCEVTPELLRQTLGVRKHKHLHPAANGFTMTSGDYRDKEDMYDEIIRLKKNLQTQKSDNQQMKVKLRRLEEDNAKREKQIEELLDPTKAPEFTRSLVDKRKEGSVILNGLKQRILKLEQQCREKENALSKLQGELRSTNLEELKVTVETYSQEIKGLRALLEAAEKSGRAESKCSQRQQKVLSSTVRRLSENLREVQQENADLREELDTDGPAGGLKGYREWSKQRLLRRLLEVEKRRGGSKRHAQSERSPSQLDVGVQATPTDCPGFTIATEAEVSVGATAEGEKDAVAKLRQRLSQLEKERAELQQTLTSKDDELRQLRTERDRLEEETVRRKGEETRRREKERQQQKFHRRELEKLWERIRTLEADRVTSDQSLCSTTAVDRDHGLSKSGLKDGGKECRSDEEKKRRDKRPRREKEKAARTIQRKWKEHREKDAVMLQSVMRGHLLRASQLKDLLKDSERKTSASAAAAAAPPACDDGDVAAVVTIQSALRGHLSRCQPTQDGPRLCVPSPVENRFNRKPQRGCHAAPSSTGAASPCEEERKPGDTVEPWPVPVSRASGTTQAADQTEVRDQAESGGSTAGDSDDSDDIIVSPSRPLRSREVLLS